MSESLRQDLSELRYRLTARGFERRASKREKSILPQHVTIRHNLEAVEVAMVDVSDKPEVPREALAEGMIKLKPKTIRLIKAGKIEKGDPLCTAKIAAILGAKKTSSLIPLCHPLPLSNIDVQTEILDNRAVRVAATVKTKAQTGVEMEALTAVAIGLLTVWDMVKQYEKDKGGQYPTTAIEGMRVVSKFKGEKAPRK
jgi:cyclic pyranopterin phosphate synthase